jgi:DNA-binding GntR family transcriptional regulator
MATRVRSSSATQPGDLTELRLLFELAALRKLADRGLSDPELAVIGKLADATVRAARSGDVLGYLQADLVFHLYLLDLTDDPAVSEVARLLPAPGLVLPPCAAESGHLMAAAREHGELVTLLTNDMASAADDLLRDHLSRLPVSRPAPARLGWPESSGGEGT